MVLTVKQALRVLGLNLRNLTNEKIKKAYRVSALKHHPNKGGNASTFRTVSNAKNLLLEYIQYYPPPRVHINKSVYKNFANKQNYKSWNNIKKVLGRPLKNNNINPSNNGVQSLRNVIEFYTALNKKNTNDRLNYFYWVAFRNHRRNKKTKEILVPSRHKII
jgi:hypothetical protein